MRASTPSCSAVTVGAVLRRMRSSSPRLTCHESPLADGIIDCCHAPLARQELPFVSTLRRDDR